MPSIKGPTPLEKLAVPPRVVRKNQCDSFDEACALVNKIHGKLAFLAKELIEAKLDRTALQKQLMSLAKKVKAMEEKGDN